MSIIGTTRAPRKGHDEFQSHNNSPAEFDCPRDNGEDYSPDDDAPEIWDDLDENEYPITADQHLADLDPRGGVEAWRIAALGRRPQDYLARDLLLNSLWRDERPRVFHDLAKSLLSGSRTTSGISLAARKSRPLDSPSCTTCTAGSCPAFGRERLPEA